MYSSKIYYVVCQGAGMDVPAGLEGEGDADVAQGVPLTVHRTDGHAPVLRLGPR